MRIARHAVQHVIGRRGAILLALAVLDFAYACGMLNASAADVQANSTWRWFNSIAPLGLWSAGWLAVGAVCVIEAFRHDDRIGYGCAWILKCAWALITLYGWAAGQLPVSSPGVWVFGAVVVWVISGWAEPIGAGEDVVHDDRTT